MARIDYAGIADAIKAQLDGAAAIKDASVRVVVEEDLVFGAEATPWVGILLMRREAPPRSQTIAAGQKVRYLVRFSLWCWQYSLDGMRTATRLRDALIGDVELALLADRTLGGTVSTSWLEGGEMAAVAEGGNFMAGGEVVLVADVTAST